ncbi:MAG: putative two-component system response regulator [Rhodoferax sp.]|jgi:putative two-component system response regulator
MMTKQLILIVDDEPVNLAAMDATLRDKHKLVFARNGTAAIAACLKHAPALILLDIEMPDMDGYAVCRQLKADPRTESIPVIFITSKTEVGDEAEGFMAGGVDYIVKPFSRDILRARVQTHLSLVQLSQLQRSHRDAIHMLGNAGHFNDTDTGVHIWRMAAYARLLACAYGLPEDLCALIELAAPMHDTGKIGISHAILKKQGRLNAQEWVEMKTHSRIGYNILSASQAPVFTLAAEIALYHHERWDGSGYPEGLAGEAIPVSARVVAVVDVFDALTMKRPYKEAWPMDQVLATIRESVGTHFEPAMIEAFESMLPQMIALKADWDNAEREEMTLFQLIYVSTLVTDNLEVLPAILDLSVRNNKQRDITGMLLYDGSNIVQVLEGKKSAVMDTFRAIQSDTRHHGIFVLVEQTIVERQFASWSMAARPLGSVDLEKRPSADLIFKNHENEIALRVRQANALSIFKSFADQNMSHIMD